MASNKPLPLAVVSIIRYPGKHDSASQESLLSLSVPFHYWQMINILIFFPYENKGGRRGCAPLGSATVRLDVATFWQRVQIFPVSTYGKVGLGLESHCLRLGIGVESTV